MRPEDITVTQARILDEEGRLIAPLPGLSDDDIRTIYWHMNLARVFNTKVLNMQKTGKVGTYPSILGQEACQAGLAHAIKDHPNVWLCQSFRETVATLARGYPMESLLQFWGGDERGSIPGAALKIAPVSIPIGSQLTHAAGIAASMNFKGEKGAAIGFVGDGGTSEGEAMEAMNFAGIMNAPVIFFIQNNQWAISVPRSKQTAAKTLAQKAIAFGFEGIQIDGNDAFVSFKIVKDAIHKAINGGGPTLIEAVTYRRDSHTTADDWHKYRGEEEVKQWETKDPIARVRKYMLSKGIWNDEHEQAMLADAQKKVEEATQKYLAMSKPSPGEMFDYVYKDLTPLQKEQKEQWAKLWGAL